MLGTSGCPCLMGKINNDDEVVYIDLASAYHYLDPSNRGEIKNIQDIKTLMESPWRLKVLEPEILKVHISGDGSKPCTVGGVHGDHRPTMWPPSFSYNKVNKFSRQLTK